MAIEESIKKVMEETNAGISSEIKGDETKIRDTLNNTPELNKSINLAAMIDHTLLKPDATVEQIRKICMEAREYKFASVCVNSTHVPFVSEILKGSGVKTCSVVGFPLGAMSTRAKYEETKDVVENGATEVDMVINIGSAKAGDWDKVKTDIEAVVNAAKGKALVKVIIETCLLTDEEKVKVCDISKMAGAHFVKTSTGFSTGGATVNDIKLMRQVVGPNMGVKASGGVKDYKAAMDMINAGASRIGTSSGIAIVQSEA